jgi:hypothetical protein
MGKNRHAKNANSRTLAKRILFRAEQKIRNQLNGEYAMVLRRACACFEMLVKTMET